MRKGKRPVTGDLSRQGGGPPAVQELRSLSDMVRQESKLLEFVGAHRFGAQLFLCDPVRFLREQGWPVNETLAAELARRRQTQPAKGRYELITEGKDQLSSVDLVVRRLAIPKDLA